MARRSELAGKRWPRRRLLTLLAAGMAVPAFADAPTREKLLQIHGRIRIVDHHADYQVRIVEHHPDLRVRWVEHHADAPGLWQRVDHHPDFEIQFVDHHADFDIQLVDSFPGLP